jgi:hypothetical protein
MVAGSRIGKTRLWSVKVREKVAGRGLRSRVLFTDMRKSSVGRCLHLDSLEQSLRQDLCARNSGSGGWVWWLTCYLSYPQDRDQEDQIQEQLGQKVNETPFQHKPV